MCSLICGENKDIQECQCLITYTREVTLTCVKEIGVLGGATGEMTDGEGGQ